MDRRCFLLTSLAGALAPPLGAGAHKAGKAPRIGILTIARTGDVQVENNFKALREGLRNLGWVDGENIAFEYRWAGGQYERLPDLASDLVRLEVKVIVGATTPLIQAVKNATTTIPIVMIGIFDPIGARFVANLAHPGGNITGLTFFPGPGLIGKQLELLKQAVPRVSRVAVLMNVANPAHGPLAREAQGAAGLLQIDVIPFSATGRQDLDNAFAGMTRENAGALLVLADAGYYALRETIAERVAKSQLPAMYGLREHVDVGGLLAYGPSILDQWKRSATYVDKILKGAKPADLPVEQPTKFELVINLKTAKALGLTIPPSLLLRADQIIE